MKPSEADKIIAEFMGMEFKKCPIDGVLKLQKQGKVFNNHGLYSKSLDALVSVWEKLFNAYDNVCLGTQLNSCYISKLKHSEMKNGDIENFMSFGETIQQAAAIATAKCILELKEQEK